MVGPEDMLQQQEHQRTVQAPLNNFNVQKAGLEIQHMFCAKMDLFPADNKSYWYGSLRQNLGQVQLDSINTQKCTSACITHLWFLTH